MQEGIFCRGRNRSHRCVRNIPDTRTFKPRGIPMEDLEIIEMRVEEIEAIRLVDLESMDLTAGADLMEVSRRTFTRDLKEGRRKVAEAMINGKAIQISGGDYKLLQEEE